MVRVVLAPDKFKGSLTAAQVASHLAAGVRAAVPGAEIVEVPMADGGDGTLAAALANGFSAVPVVASGPTGMPVRTAFGRRESSAVVELADVCGLSRLPGGRPAPLTASSRGAGEVLAAALEAGCRAIVVGLGGSASTDGGAGLLRGLGARVTASDGTPVAEGGGALRRAAALDLSHLHEGLADATIVLASDVDNPLTGPRGAAAVYGPQKGAGEAAVRALETALTHWADLVETTVRDPRSLPPWLASRDPVPFPDPVPVRARDRWRDLPGAGAAGGVGFAALAVLGAVRRPGTEVVAELVGLATRVRGADLVVTGEGCLDSQSLHGKAPFGVASVAAEHGVPTVVVCGRLALSPAELTAAGFTRAYSLDTIEPDQQRSMAQAGPLLERLGHRVATEHLT